MHRFVYVPSTNVSHCKVVDFRTAKVTVFVGDDPLVTGNRDSNSKKFFSFIFMNDNLFRNIFRLTRYVFTLQRFSNFV